jgi:hypoxanthine-guanine phosphoribosyltransferase
MPIITPETHAGVVYFPNLIDKREEAMVDEIMDKYDEDLLLVGLLTGGTRLLHDLLGIMGTRNPHFNPEYEFMRTVNYGPGADAQGPRLATDLPPHVEVKGRQVALVDDMIDSGGSTDLAERHLSEDLGAVDVIKISLVYRSVRVKAGNVVENEFPKPDIYGLDYDDIFFLTGRGLNGPDSGRGGGRAWPFIAKCAFQPDEVIKLRG